MKMTLAEIRWMVTEKNPVTEKNVWLEIMATKNCPMQLRWDLSSINDRIQNEMKRFELILNGITKDHHMLEDGKPKESVTSNGIVFYTLTQEGVKKRDELLSVEVDFGEKIKIKSIDDLDAFAPIHLSVLRRFVDVTHKKHPG